MREPTSNDIRMQIATHHAKAEEIREQLVALYGERAGHSKWYDYNRKTAFEHENLQTALEHALNCEGKTTCSSCYKVFETMLRRDGKPYKTCPKCRAPSHLEQAFRATKECAHSRDFLNCRPCPKNYAREGSCALSEAHRLENIKSYYRILQGIERHDYEARLFGFDLKKHDASVCEATQHKFTNVDEMLGWLHTTIEYLESFSFSGELAPARRRWGQGKD